MGGREGDNVQKSQLADGYPALAYQQLQTGDFSQRQNAAAPSPGCLTFSAENQAIIDNAYQWVSLLPTLQITFSAMCLFFGWVWTPSMSLFQPFNVFMAIIGVIGLRRQNVCLLLSHFVYSMVGMFGLIMLFSLGVFYCDVGDYWYLGLLAFIVLFVSFLLRKQRLLIRALCSKKVPARAREDIEDPMVVELPLEPAYAIPQEVPVGATAPVVEEQALPAAFYPAYPQPEGTPMMQPVPMIIQTGDGTQQVVYVYPVMPNPQQFVPAGATTQQPQAQQ